MHGGQHAHLVLIGVHEQLLEQRVGRVAPRARPGCPASTCGSSRGSRRPSPASPAAAASAALPPPGSSVRAVAGSADRKRTPPSAPPARPSRPLAGARDRSRLPSARQHARRATRRPRATPTAAASASHCPRDGRSDRDAAGRGPILRHPCLDFGPQIARRRRRTAAGRARLMLRGVVMSVDLHIQSVAQQLAARGAAAPCRCLRRRRASPPSPGASSRRCRSSTSTSRAPSGSRAIAASISLTSTGVSKRPVAVRSSSSVSDSDSVFGVTAPALASTTFTAMRCSQVVDRAARLEPVERPPGVDERLLGAVLGVGGIPGHAQA